MFDAYISSNQLHQSKKPEIFTSNLDRFAEYLLNSTSVDWRCVNGFTSKDFATYLGIFSNYCAMKKVGQNSRVKHKLSKVYSVLYEYSHVKFNAFMAIPEIKTLVQIIWENSGKETLVNGNSTLNANRESYEAHIDKLLKSFN